MKEYVYSNCCAANYDEIEATFEFTDIDGNCVKGAHSSATVLELLESLGDAMIEQFHHTRNKPDSWMNGIIDTSKPITIVINSTHAPHAGRD